MEVIIFDLSFVLFLKGGDKYMEKNQMIIQKRRLPDVELYAICYPKEQIYILNTSFTGTSKVIWFYRSKKK